MEPASERMLKVGKQILKIVEDETMDSNNKEIGLRHLLWALELIAWTKVNKIPGKELTHVLDAAKIAVLYVTQARDSNESDESQIKRLGDAIYYMATRMTNDDEQ